MSDQPTIFDPLKPKPVLPDILRAEQGDLCQCPLCGRTHRHLQAGKPPEIISAVVALPRAQYEALVAAREVLKRVKHWDDFVEDATFGLPHHVEQQVSKALAALSAAGIHEGEKPND